MYKNLISDLNKAVNIKKARILAGFFKTKKGDYGEGDAFLGITVPKQRKIAKGYINLGLRDIQRLLNNKYHEYRLVALIILIEKYLKADKDLKKQIVTFYFKNAKGKNINNWDLVDLSAPKILGDYLFDKEKKVLYDLAGSNYLWERRIAILTTFYFIRKKRFVDTLKISEILINDKHDLIHKAVGWMLREVGKRDLAKEINFLNKFSKVMPRVMLRYAIEKFSKTERQKYLIKNK